MLVKCFTEEQGSEKAKEIVQEQLTGASLFIIPETCIFEVLNALKYKGVSEQQLCQITTNLLSLGFHTEPAQQFFLEETIRCSKEHSLTIYDAAYAALAVMHDASLITADKQLAKVPNAILVV